MDAQNITNRRTRFPGHISGTLLHTRSSAGPTLLVTFLLLCVAWLPLLLPLDIVSGEDPGRPDASVVSLELLDSPVLGMETRLAVGLDMQGGALGNTSLRFLEEGALVLELELPFLGSAVDGVSSSHNSFLHQGRMFSTGDGAGYLNSTDIMLPEGASWDGVELELTLEEGAWLDLKVVDAVSGEQMEDVVFFGSGWLDLSSIDRDSHPGIRLEARLVSKGYQGVALAYWCVRWEGAPGAWGDSFTQDGNVTLPWTPETAGQRNLSIQLHSQDDGEPQNNSRYLLTTVSEPGEVEFYPGAISARAERGETLEYRLQLKNNAAQSRDWFFGSLTSSARKVGILNTTSNPGYFSGGNENLYQLYADALEEDKRFELAVVETLNATTIQDLDTIILADNVVAEEDLDDMDSWFVEEKTIICVDSAVCYAGYSGFMWPDAKGSHGKDEYWGYGTEDDGQMVTLEHRITGSYELDDILITQPGNAYLIDDALEPDTLVFTRKPNDNSTAYIVGRAVEDRGDIFVLGPMPKSGEDLVSLYPLIREACFGIHNSWELPHWLAVDSPFGTLASGAQENLTLTVHSSLLEPGNYQELISLCHSSGGVSVETLNLGLEITQPEHDLAVLALDPLAEFEAGRSAAIEITVANLGNGTEKDLRLLLKANGTTVDSRDIATLAPTDEGIFSLDWTPAFGGSYLLQAYVVPVDGERLVDNNLFHEHVQVKADSELWLSDTGFNFSMGRGEGAQQELVVWNQGLGDLRFQLEQLPGEEGRTTVGFSSQASFGNTTDKYKCNAYYVTRDVLLERIDIYLESTREVAVDILIYRGDQLGGSYTRVHQSRHISPSTGGTPAFQGTGLLQIPLEAGSYYVTLFKLDHDDGVLYYYESDPELKTTSFCKLEGGLSLASPIFETQDIDPDTGLAYYQRLTVAELDAVLPASVLDIQPATGTVKPGENSSVTLTASARDLAPGEYLLNLSLTSNDPAQEELRIPIALEVGRRDHDISMGELTVPSYVSWQEGAVVEAVVRNHGLVDQLGLNVSFTANGEDVSSITLPYLPATEERLEFQENLSVSKGLVGFHQDNYETVFLDAFSNVSLDTDKWAEGSYSGMASGYSHSPPHSCDLDSSDFLNSSTLDLSGYRDGELSFFYKRSGMDLHEFFRVEYHNQDAQWVELWVLSGGPIDGFFRQLVLELPTEAHHENFAFRLSLYPGGNSGDDIYIDDVLLEAVPEQQGFVVSEEIAVPDGFSLASLDVHSQIDSGSNISFTLLEFDGPSGNWTPVPGYQKLQGEEFDISSLGHISRLKIRAEFISNGSKCWLDSWHLTASNDSDLGDVFLWQDGFGSGQLVRFPWRPQKDAWVELQVKAFAPPEDGVVWDNAANTTVWGFRSRGTVLVDRAHSSYVDEGTHEEFLGSLQLMGYKLVDSRIFITPRLLENSSILVIIGSKAAYLPAEETAIKDFVADGGGLLVTGDASGSSGTTDLSGFAGIRSQAISGSPGETYSIAEHEITRDINSLVCPGVHNSLELFGPAVPCVLDSSGKTVQAAAAGYGNGRVVVLANQGWLADELLHNEANNQHFAREIVNWLGLGIRVNLSSTQHLVEAGEFLDQHFELWSLSWEGELNITLEGFREGWTGGLDIATLSLEVGGHYSLEFNLSTPVELHYADQLQLFLNFSLNGGEEFHSIPLDIRIPPGIAVVQKELELSSFGNQSHQMELNLYNLEDGDLSWELDPVCVKGNISKVKVAVLKGSGTDLWDYQQFWNYLNSNWREFGNVEVEIDYESFEGSSFTLEELESSAAHILYAADSHQGFDSVTMKAIEDYLLQGHGLVASYRTPTSGDFLEPLGLVEGASRGGSLSTYDWKIAEHSILYGLDDPFFLSNSDSYGEWAAGGWAPATILAASSAGDNAVMVRETNHRSVYLSAPVEDGSSSYTDHRLIYNSILWAASQDPLSVSPTPGSGVLEAKENHNANQTLNISLDTTGLLPGDYSYQLRLLSNDPLQPELPVWLNVTILSNDAPYFTKGFPDQIMDQDQAPVSFVMEDFLWDNESALSSLNITLFGWDPAILNPELKDGILILEPAGATGSTTLQVQVSDGEGGSCVTSINVQVIHNLPPRLQKGIHLELDDDQTMWLDLGDLVVDEYPETLIWQYQYTGTRLQLDLLQEGLLQIEPLKGLGGHNTSFLLTVSDAWGKNDTSLVSIFVKDVNQAPVILAGIPDLVFRNATVGSMSFDLEPYGFDPETGQEHLLWSLDYQSESFAAEIVSGSTLVVTRLSGSQGSGEITLILSDEEGKSATQIVWVELRSFNLRPILVQGLGQLETVEQKETILHPQVQDPDGEILLFRWDFDGDGIVDSSSNNTARGSYHYQAPGVYNAVLEVMDDAGENSSFQFLVTVNRNLGPVLRSGLAFSRLREDEEKSFVVSVEDPDGTVILLEWDFDGDGKLDWASNSGTPANFAYPAPGNYTAILYVTDNLSATNSFNFTIEVTEEEDTGDGNIWLLVFSGAIIAIVAAWLVLGFIRSPEIMKQRFKELGRLINTKAEPGDGGQDQNTGPGNSGEESSFSPDGIVPEEQDPQPLKPEESGPDPNAAFLPPERRPGARQSSESTQAPERLQGSDPAVSDDPSGPQIPFSSPPLSSGSGEELDYEKSVNAPMADNSELALRHWSRSGKRKE